MSGTIDFAHPWLLLLLPLAGMPLLRSHGDALGFSYLALLPRDRLGQLAEWLWRAMACCVLHGRSVPPGRLRPRLIPKTAT